MSNSDKKMQEPKIPWEIVSAQFDAEGTYNRRIVMLYGTSKVAMWQIELL